MRNVSAWAALAAAAVACGGGGIGSGDGEPGGADLWPLAAGTRWTYRVTDPLRGTFDKTVEVRGAAPVPGTGQAAVLVVDSEPALEEHSWQYAQGGLVFRAREEDLAGGAVVRTTTWQPAALKSIAAPASAGWTHDAIVRETIRYPDLTVVEKDERYVWTVLAVGERVEVPAGVFDGCVRLQRVKADKPGSERTYWLAPGVGKVKEAGERDELLVRFEAP